MYESVIDSREPLSSLCLVGPDGSGKTVLALHLAARYLHDMRLIADVPAADDRRRGDVEDGIARIDPNRCSPAIIYASVDLSPEKAQETWEHFALDRLKERDAQLYPAARWRDDPKLRLLAAAQDPVQSLLQPLDDDGAIVKFSERSPGMSNVGFLDLRPKAAGDPWNYLRRVLTILASSAANSSLPSLLVVDSIDALFTLSGSVDAYGETRSRESRVSQLLDAGRNSTHIVLLVGAGDEDDRAREAYLSDSVVRVRVVKEAGYYSRLVEVEKARAQSSVRGRHRFSIRSGEGSTTGRQPNPDDPRISLHGSERPLAYIRVFHSIDFLDSFERSVRDETREPWQLSHRSRLTGIRFLDNMLPLADPELADQPLKLGTVTSIIGSAKTFKSNVGRAFLACGLSDPLFGDGTLVGSDFDRLSRDLEDMFATPSRSQMHANLAPVIEDAGIPRSEVLFRIFSTVLGRAPTEAEAREYLEEGDAERRFQFINRLLRDLGPDAEKLGTLTKQIWRERRRREKLRSGPGVGTPGPGFCILLTSDDIRPERAARHLLEWLRPQIGWASAKPNPREVMREKRLLAWIESRLICRRLEAHTVYPETLIHIVLRCIYLARMRLGISGADTLGNRARSGQIRLVIDDWSSICQMYPAVGADSKCLQFLLREIRRLGVTALVVNSRALTPGQLLSAGGGDDLAAVSDVVFTTWPVAFRGRRLAAICVGEPGRNVEATIVREVRHSRNSDERLIVDPRLELYRGLFREEAEPEPVPLRVVMLDEAHAGKEFLTATRALFRELFASVPGRNAVIETMPAELDLHAKYEQLRSLCYFQTGSLDHTLVVLVDEFWSVEGHPVFRLLREYFDAETNHEDEEYRLLLDPHELFRKRLDALPRSCDRRKDFFDGGLFRGPALTPEWLRGDEEAHPSLEPPSRKLGGPIEPARGLLHDRVPYSWDFAFLTCRVRAWENAQTRWVEAWDPGDGGAGTQCSRTVKQVWDALDTGRNPLLPGYLPDEGSPSGMKLVASPELPTDGGFPDLQSWRWFLGAAQVVAQSDNLLTTKHVIPFDFHSAGPETFGCWVLEVWASEIQRSIQRDLRMGRPPVESAHQKRVESFSEWMRGANGVVGGDQGLLRWLGHDGTESGKEEMARSFGRIDGDDHVSFESLRTSVGWCVELYKALRLISDFVFELDWIVPSQKGKNPPRAAAPGAVAVRDFYKTAALRVDAYDDSDPTVVIRLPGNFSTRGDLALAIATESRSVRLGERTIDKLCSRAANHTRLATGIGLPVRRLSIEERQALRTRLLTVERVWEPATSNPRDYYPPVYVRPLKYSEILEVAPNTSGNAAYCWLWRSRMTHYDSQSVVWQHWLHSVLDSFFRLRRARGVAWARSLEAYDVMERWQCGVVPSDDKRRSVTDGRPPKLTTFRQFGISCLSLISQLEAATPAA